MFIHSNGTTYEQIACAPRFGLVQACIEIISDVNNIMHWIRVEVSQYSMHVNVLIIFFHITLRIFLVPVCLKIRELNRVNL